VRVLPIRVDCVGKTTISRCLADFMGLRFFDRDTEIKKDITYFRKSHARADVQGDQGHAEIIFGIGE